VDSPNRHHLRVLNRQLRALEAVPLLSDEAAQMFEDDELGNAVVMTKKHLLLIHKLIAERGDQ
jgi:hypothetical protein